MKVYPISKVKASLIYRFKLITGFIFGAALLAACATTTPPQGQGQNYPPVAGQYPMPNGQTPPPIQNPNKGTPKETAQSKLYAKCRFWPNASLYER